MNEANVYLAIDLGAESGRAVAGVYDGHTLELEELHRFANAPVEEDGGLHWDVGRLFAEVKTGIAKAAQRFGDRLVSVGVDSWAIDYGLLDKRGELLGKPFAYRDRRTDGVLERVIGLVGRDRLYETTGLQFLPFNTIYQLVAELDSPSSKLRSADSLLFIPDLINYWLTGRKVNERTNASTSQFYDPRTRAWATELLEELRLPTSMLLDIADPGTRLGPLLPAVAEETGARSAEVALPGTHDTASAVAAVPAYAGSWAFLSSGTWSLLGVETPEPVITPKTKELALANEIGVCETVRLLKNVSGLWLVQQCRSTWERRGESVSYAELTRLAEAAPPFFGLIDPDDERFVPPGHMPRRITEYCRETGQEPPHDRGSLVRTILESLALRYRTVLEGLEAAVGHTLDTLHIVGGGAQNELLNQLTASSIGRRVVAGPVEATSAGNVLMQMMAMGEIGSLQEGRDIVRRSFELTTYDPADRDAWDAAYRRFLELASRSG